MPDPFLILRALAIAGGVAGVVLLASSWPWGSPHPSRTALGWVLGVAAALVVGSLALGLEVRWPPLEDRHRFVLIVLPAAVTVEAIAAVRRVPRWVAWLLRAAVAAGAGRVLLHGSTYLQEAGEFDLGQWTAEEAVRHFSVLAGALLAVWALLGLLLHVAPSRSVPMALAVACAGAAGAVMLSGSLAGGQFGLVLAAALVGATAGSFLLPTPPSGTAPIGIGVVGLFALLVRGRFFADLTSLDAALLFAAPLLCWLTCLPPITKLRPRLRGALRIVVVAIPVTIAAYQEFQASNERARPPAGEEEDSYEQYYK